MKRESIAPTSEDVRSCYRLFLNREPEDQRAIDVWLRRVASRDELRNAFMNSDEFLARNQVGFTPAMTGLEPPLKVERAQDPRDLFDHIQKTWEEFGRVEPHWSVLSAEAYTQKHIEGSREQFYSSGEGDAAKYLASLSRNGVEVEKLSTCLEYGCGVGRTTAALSKRFQRVYGYDISRPHLDLAELYCKESKIDNVTLRHVQSLQDVEKFPLVDAVYSVIVLQHNPPPVITKTLRGLLHALKPGGVAYFQLPTYHKDYEFRVDAYLADQMQGAEMEMHLLPQAEVFALIRSSGGEVLEVLEDDQAGLSRGRRSNTFIVRRPASA